MNPNRQKIRARGRAVRGGLVVGAVGLLATLVLSTLALRDADSSREAQVALCILCFVPWLLAVTCRGAITDSRRAIVLVLSVALAARLLVLPVPPVFSGDLYRYHWDGEASLHGLNPLTHAPSSQVLVHLRGEVPGWEQINHPELATIYPPVAQVVFAAGASLGGATGIKVLFALADLALCGAVLALLRRRGRPPGDIILYAWNPFPIMEFSGIGHVDPIMWAPAFAAFALLAGRRDGDPERTRTLGAGALIGLAILSKLFAIVALPYLLRRRRDWPAAAAAVIVLGVGFAAFALPLEPDPTGQHSLVERSPARGLCETLVVFGSKWRWNGSLFPAAEDVVLAVTGLDPAKTGPTYIEQWTKAALAIPVMILAMAQFLRRRPRDALQAPEAGTRALIGAYLWTSPVVHPWYVAWALPGATLGASAGWFYLAAASWLTYLTPPGAAGVPTWILIVEYVPAALLLVWGAWPRGGRAPTGR